MRLTPLAWHHKAPKGPAHSKSTQTSIDEHSLTMMKNDGDVYHGDGSDLATRTYSAEMLEAVTNPSAKRARVDPDDNRRIRELASLARSAEHYRDSPSLRQPDQVLEVRSRYLKAFSQKLSAQEACDLIDAHLPCRSEAVFWSERSPEKEDAITKPIALLALDRGSADYGCRRNINKLARIFMVLEHEHVNGGRLTQLSHVEQRALLKHTTLCTLFAETAPHRRWNLLKQALDCRALTFPPDLVHLMLGRMFVPLIDKSAVHAKTSILSRYASTAATFKLVLDPMTSGRFADEAARAMQQLQAHDLFTGTPAVETTLRALSDGVLQLNARQHAELSASLGRALPFILRDASSVRDTEAASVVTEVALNALEKQTLASSPDLPRSMFALLSESILRPPGDLRLSAADAYRFLGLALPFLRNARAEPPQKALVLAAVVRTIETHPDIRDSDQGKKFIAQARATLLAHAPSPDIAAALRPTAGLTADRDLDETGLATAADLAAHGVEGVRPNVEPLRTSVVRFLKTEGVAGRWHCELLAKTMHMLQVRRREVDDTAAREIVQLAVEMRAAPIARAAQIDLLCALGDLRAHLMPDEESRWLDDVGREAFARDVNRLQRLRLIRILTADGSEATAPRELHEPFATLANPLAEPEARRTQFFKALEQRETLTSMAPAQQRLLIENLALLFADDAQISDQRRCEHIEALDTVLGEEDIDLSYEAHRALLRQALAVAADSLIPRQDQARYTLLLLEKTAERVCKISGPLADKILQVLESNEARKLLLRRDALRQLLFVDELGIFTEPDDIARLNALLDASDPSVAAGRFAF